MSERSETLCDHNFHQLSNGAGHGGGNASARVAWPSPCCETGPMHWISRIVNAVAVGVIVSWLGACALSATDRRAGARSGVSAQSPALKLAAAGPPMPAYAPARAPDAPACTSS